MTSRSTSRDLLKVDVETQLFSIVGLSPNLWFSHANGLGSSSVNDTAFVTLSISHDHFLAGASLKNFERTLYIYFLVNMQSHLSFLPLSYNINLPKR